jgi:hypothetical protein
MKKLCLQNRRHAELVSASIVHPKPAGSEAKWTLKQVQGDVEFGR